MKIHFVYAGYYYNTFVSGSQYEDRLRSFIRAGMKKYKVNSVMVTMTYMWKHKIITKETMEKYCNGEKYPKNSVNDDLESFFEDIRLGKEPDEEVTTYFLPKLTEEEMELVERKDTSYFETYMLANPDVAEGKMKLSESDLKFARGYGWRKTFTIENSSSPSI